VDFVSNYRWNKASEIGEIICAAYASNPANVNWRKVERAARLKEYCEEKYAFLQSFGARKPFFCSAQRALCLFALGRPSTYKALAFGLQLTLEADGVWRGWTGAGGMRMPAEEAEGPDPPFFTADAFMTIDIANLYSDLRAFLEPQPGYKTE
jgi:hypothetical protein